MDLDNLQQNLNTRVVFKEPRGMVRWLQLLFAIIAVSTICDYQSTIGINITCPSGSTTTTSTTSTTTQPPANSSNPATLNVSSSTPTPQVAAPAIAAGETSNPKLVIKYPFNFVGITVNNTCPGNPHSYNHVGSLSGSPEFFVMTGFLSLFYAIGTLIVYLLFSSTYDSIPVMPVADLIITALLCLLWFVASSAFSSGVSLLKNTLTYGNLKQALCPEAFEQLPGVQCSPMPEFADWKSINVGLVSGFASFFLWGFGLWFVYKETHFHTPRGPLSL